MNPPHVDKLRWAGYDAEEATKDLDAGIAEVRKRLEADGTLAVTQPTGTRPGRRPFVGLAGAGSARSRRTRSSVRRPATDDAPDESPPADEPAVGLLVSTQCRHLIRTFRGDTEAHVGKAITQDHALDALRDASE